MNIYQLPPLNDDELFEAMIRDLINASESTNSFVKRGVQGQEQEGIDIYSPEKLIGIQCKKKDIIFRKGSTLKRELINEIERTFLEVKGSGFTLKRLILASTYKDDKSIQDFAISLNADGFFTVEYWGWGTILNLLDIHRDVRDRYYHGLIVGIEKSYKKAEEEIRRSFKRTKLEELEMGYIPRTVRKVEENTSFSFLRSEPIKNTSLIELIKERNRIVLLSVGGFGKSIELKYLANIFSEKSDKYFPLFITLKNYDNSIQDLISVEYKNWNEIPENKLLVLFDGLDEVHSNKLSKVIIAINNFSTAHPNLKIAVSCRTNFLNAGDENKRIKSDLVAFDFFLLNPIAGEAIENFVRTELSGNSPIFLDEVKRKGIENWLQSPFNLITLIKEFKKNGVKRLPSNKHELYDLVIEAKIAFDKEKYRKNGLRIPENDDVIIKALMLIAISMEGLGKNQIDYSTLRKIVPDDNLRQLIEYSFLFNKNPSNQDIYEFEHNNIQEYLAAKLLAGQSFNLVKQYLFHSPDFKILKATWVNTLSFLFDILKGNPVTLQLLINWIIQNDKASLVRIETDKIELLQREKIFFEIIDDSWIKKGISFYSQNFYPHELAKFSGGGDQVIDRLLTEIENNNIGDVVRDALSLIEHVEDITNFEDRARKALLKIVIGERYGDQLVNEALNALGKLNLHSDVITKTILAKLDLKKSSRIREGIYDYLNLTNQSDKYIDVFLVGRSLLREGLIGTANGSNTSDSEPHNTSEDFALAKGLKSAKSVSSVKKIINYFIHAPSHIDLPYNNDAVKTLTKNFIEAYQYDSSIYDLVLLLIETIQQRHEESHFNAVREFFVETNTLLDTFKYFLLKKKEPNYQNSFIGCQLADENCVEYFISQMKLGNYDSKAGWDLLFNIRMRPEASSRIHDYAYRRLNEEFQNGFTYKPNDFEQRQEKIKRNNLQLLLNKRVFLKEVKAFFIKHNKDFFSHKELWDTWKDMGVEVNYDYDSNIVFYTISEFCETTSVSYDQIVTEFDKLDRWEWFKIRKLKQIFESKGENRIPEHHIEFIKKWCYKWIKKVNFFKTYQKKKDGRYLTHYRPIYIGYFWLKLDFKIAEETILDMLMIADKGGEERNDLTDKILTNVETDKIVQRVLQNMRDGIISDSVLSNHIALCANLNIINSKNELVKIFNNNISTGYIKRDALETYITLGGRFDILEQMLPKVNFSNDSMAWQDTVVKFLIKQNSEKLKKRLIELIDDSSIETAYQFHSANYLLELGAIEGVKKFYDWILQNKKNPPVQLNANKIHLAPLHASVDLLLKMLKLVHEFDLIRNTFNGTESFVRECLNSFALVPEEGLLFVRNKIQVFIEQNENSFPGVKFYYHWIRSMEFYYYRNKSSIVDMTIINQMNEELILD